MIRRRLSRLQRWQLWEKRHWRKLSIYAGVSVAAVFIFIQILYPDDRLVPLANIDGQNVGGWSKSDASKLLDDKYKNQKIHLYFGERDKPYRTPLSDEIGLKIENHSRLDQVSYSRWLRIIPTSILWANSFTNYGAPKYESNKDALDNYVKKELGESCNVAPINATLKANGAKLEVVPAKPSGKCKIEDVKKSIANVRPRLNEKAVVRVAMKKMPPDISDEAANEFGQKIEQRIGSGVVIKAGEKNIKIDTATLLGWLDFPVVEGHLTVAVNSDRASEFMAKNIAPSVTIAAGKSKITTMDFVVTARVDGNNGQALNTAATLQNLADFLLGTTDQIEAVAQIVPPSIEYTRNYSSTDAGLSALMQHYAETHPGSYGISLVELSGKRRHAAYNDTKQFQTASTYKLFVAYSTLRRVETGAWNWSDQVSGGRNLEKCFDDMIVRSDNPCAETLLQRIGFGPIKQDLQTLGLSRTSFSKDVPLTTAGDLVAFLATLENGSMFTSTSRDRLINAMKRNIFRQGIPAGSSGQVADKVGFINGLLHDAAIIYGPNGTTVLAVMTDGSSWNNIAELTRQIEELLAR